MKISPERFIEVWQTSNSAGQVADTLKISIGTAGVRAHFYRSRGVPLKKMSKAGRQSGMKLNWQKLAELARSFE